MGKTKQNGILHRLRKNSMCGVLSCVLVLGAVLTMPGMGMTARADKEYEVNGFKYKGRISEGSCNTTGCDENKLGEVVYIPAQVNIEGHACNVLHITSRAFVNCKKIKKITIGEGIFGISSYAFSNSSITEIEIPASIGSISSNVFDGCNITKIRFNGTMPPSLGFNKNWLGNAANNNIIIELPEGADINVWQSAIDPDNRGYNFNIQTYTPASSSGCSSSTSSPNQEKNNDGEVEVIEEEPVNRIPAHVCQYEWEVVREVGADQDGLEQYFCKLCGNVQSTLTIPASQYQVQELYTKVTGAADGETVTYDTGMVHTVCDKLFTKLQERKDITLVLTYQYKGESYRTTFPAGADYTELMQDTDQFYGMLGLNGRCGIVTEKN